MDAARNLGLPHGPDAACWLAHKPLVRTSARSGASGSTRRSRPGRGDRRRIAEVAAGAGPIVVGPWLAEVGYEVLYWIPFLRWFQDAHGVPRERFIVVSRGGLESCTARGRRPTWTSSTCDAAGVGCAERRAAGLA